MVRATHFERPLFANASYPTHPFLRLSFSRFHIFNISAFQIPKCFNFFGRVLNICMRSDFEGLVGGRPPAGGLYLRRPVPRVVLFTPLWKHMHSTCPPSPLSYLAIHLLQLHMIITFDFTPSACLACISEYQAIQRMCFLT